MSFISFGTFAFDGTKPRLAAKKKNHQNASSVLNQISISLMYSVGYLFDFFFFFLNRHLLSTCSAGLRERGLPSRPKSWSSLLHFSSPLPSLPPSVPLRPLPLRPLPPSVRGGGGLGWRVMPGDGALTFNVRSALPAAAAAALSDGIRGYLPSSTNPFILNLNPDPRAMIRSYFEVRRCNVIALLKRSYPPNIDKLQARNKM